MIEKGEDIRAWLKEPSDCALWGEWALVKSFVDGVDFILSTHLRRADRQRQAMGPLRAFLSQIRNGRRFEQPRLEFGDETTYWWPPVHKITLNTEDVFLCGHIGRQIIIMAQPSDGQLVFWGAPKDWCFLVGVEEADHAWRVWHQVKSRKSSFNSNFLPEAVSREFYDAQNIEYQALWIQFYVARAYRMPRDTIAVLADRLAAAQKYRREQRLRGS